MNNAGMDGGKIFYERRYAKGYMDDWSMERKTRIREIIHSMNLPEVGNALDFGCGTGVFTQVLKDTLPRWTVFGADISHTAIVAARERHGDCIFYELEDPRLSGKAFDFVFSNHVLEHVHDLTKELERLALFSAKGAAVLHVLPCGNEGSFEHGICLMVKNGFDRAKDNRFFFEDDGHVRRLTTDDMRSSMVGHNMALVREYYANQYHGSILWITEDPRNVGKVFDPRNAIDSTSARRLRRYRAVFVILCMLRLPSVIVRRFLGKKWNRRPLHYLLFAAAMPLYPISWGIDFHVRYKSDQEWREKKHQRNGSEMYLQFKMLRPVRLEKSVR